jgi:hypothetical protein
MGTKTTPMTMSLPGMADLGLDTTGIEGITYERLWNLGNFENARVGVFVRLQPGESAGDALARGRLWVEAQKPENAK